MPNNIFSMFRSKSLPFCIYLSEYCSLREDLTGMWFICRICGRMFLHKFSMCIQSGVAWVCISGHYLRNSPSLSTIYFRGCAPLSIFTTYPPPFTPFVVKTVASARESQGPSASNIKISFSFSASHNDLPKQSLNCRQYRLQIIECCL